MILPIATDTIGASLIYIRQIIQLGMYRISGPFFTIRYPAIWPIFHYPVSGYPVCYSIIRYPAGYHAGIRPDTG